MRSEKEQIQKWVNTWANASDALYHIKKNDMQSVDYYEKNQHILADMLTYAVKHGKERYSSGLVEQQRFFKLLKEKMEHENGE